MRRGRLEICTIGANPNLQLVGADGPYDLGIFVRSAATANRQTFVLALKRFNVGQRGRLVGFRQYLTIGVNEPSLNGATYPLERPIETPTWKFVDGNVLWGIRQIPPETHFLPNALNAEGQAFEYSSTPALLFETIVGNVVTPPFGGQFPGNVLTPELGRFFDLRCRRWSKPSHCDIPFEGPCDIAFFASVLQTDPQTRTAPPAAPQFLTTQGTVPEDAFLQNYPGSTYFRIAGSLIFEMEEQAPTGAPKTYRRPGDADRLTRDTTEVGDNTMRRSAEDTSEYKACEENAPGQPSPPPKRPQSPPHPNAGALGKLPDSISRWREARSPGLEPGHVNKHKALPPPTGLGSLPPSTVSASDTVIGRLIKKWRHGKGGPR